MNGLGSILGRGLLVLALGGFAIACGDDDSGDGHDQDAGAGSGGSRAGNGGGGTGGDDDAGTAGRGGRGGTGGMGMMVTEQECIDMTETNTGGMLNDACISCLCEANMNQIAACTPGCWALISCFQANCSEFTPGSTEATQCATSNCGEAIAMPGALMATPTGEVIRSECPDECVPSDGPDSGVDAGN